MNIILCVFPNICIYIYTEIEFPEYINGIILHTYVKSLTHSLTNY